MHRDRPLVVLAGTEHDALNQRAHVDRSEVELLVTGLETLQRQRVVDKGSQP